MDWIWIVLGSLLMVAGLIGSIIPVLPGPPLSYIGILLLQLTSKSPFAERFLVSWGLITIAVTVLDYIVPIWGTRQFGGSKLGVWGSTLGLLVGLILFQGLGLIVGPFVGAVLGELIDGKNGNQALRAGFGSFLGFVAGTLMKLCVAVILAYHFIASLI